MLRRQQVIAGAIILFWLIMMGQLYLREGANSPLGTTTPILQKPADTWMGIYAGGPDDTESKIGYMRTQSIPTRVEGDPGTEYRLTLKLETKLLSYPAEIYLTGSSWVSLNKGLQRVQFKVDSFDQHVMEAKGTADENNFNLEITTSGETFPMTIPMNRNMMISGGLGTTTLHIPSLEVGDQVIIPTFDPMTFTYNQRSIVKCVGTETFVFARENIPVKILETESNGIKNTIWVTMENEVVRVETPFGFHLRKVTPSEALEAPSLTSATDLLNAVAVRPTGEKVFRGAESMTIKLSNLPEDTFPPNDRIQSEIDTLTYRIEPPQPNETAPLVEATTPFEDSLRGDAFVQTEHEEIRALADQLTDPQNSPWENAQSIYQWCWDNITKIPVLSFPSAIDVARTLEGDCNEHTVLYTAIARAAGIPTRMAIGIVWSDELNGFYYHAWPEVYIDQWIPVDPTLGQPIADATHIKFMEGNMDSWPKLMAYLGQVQVEVLEIQ